MLNKICGSIQQLGIESLLFQPPEVPTNEVDIAPNCHTLSWVYMSDFRKPLERSE